MLLCVTGDQALGECCAHALRALYDVEFIGSLHAMGRLQGKRAFRMIVVSYTLIDARWTSTIRLTRARWPSIRVLNLSQAADARTKDGKGNEIGVLAGPEDSLFSVARLLHAIHL